ncbi:MAG: RimK family alpha-L-glutamate ligase [Maricaulaceae bacterium]
MRVAYLSSEDVIGPAAGRRTDAFEHDLMMATLDGADPDVRFEAVQWDADADWSAFDAVMIGTTWDYMRRRAAFLDRLGEIARATPLYNSPQTVAWNIDKRYLADLSVRGAPVLPLRLADRASPETAAEAMRAFDTDCLVIKPQIGAGGWRQALYAAGDPWPEADALPPGPAILQPFLPAIQTEGEYSLIYIDRTFSHALRKSPAQGDYRVQSSYGGREEVWVPDAEARAAAEACLAQVKDELLYARVDLARGREGRLELMELEVIEPYLYPKQGPELGARVTAALKRRLD